MTHITISVKIMFSIRKFPIDIAEIFRVIYEITASASREIAIVLLKRIESEAAEPYKGKGYNNRGSQKRILRGLLGEIKLPILRIQKSNDPIICPLLQKISIPAFRRLTDDVYETCLGLLPHVSYRRSVKEAERIDSNNGPSKSSLHRHLKRIAPTLEIHPERDVKGYNYVIVDGTGARIQKWIDNYLYMTNETQKGQIRVVYASERQEGPYRVIGRWTDQDDWKTIAQETYRRIDPNDLKVLISDGENAIENAFKLDHMSHQRCSVHGWRELKIFLYLDGLKKAQQEKYLQMMGEVPVFEYAKNETLEALKPSDKPEIRKVISESRNQLEELTGVLEKKGYNKAATYVGGLTAPLMTFLEHWLATGEYSPHSSNLAENRFSLFKNRIARIGKRWSEDGLLRFFDLTVHKIFPGYDWETLISKLLPKSGNITCMIESVIAT